MADTTDELKIIKNLLEKQNNLVQSLKAGMQARWVDRPVKFGPFAEDNVVSERIAPVEKLLKSAFSNVNEIKTEAEET